MVGRGLRIHSGKDHVLVLDFAGNTQRLGPINDPSLPGVKKNGDGGGEPIVKTCPNCGCLHHPTVKICDVCNHIFTFKQKIETQAKDVEVVRGPEEPPKWMKVDQISYYIHNKIGKPDSLKVRYLCGLLSINDFICLEHKGYAREKAINWVNFRWTGPLNEYPTTISDLYEHRANIKTPQEILIKNNKKYPEIIDYRL